MHKHHLDLQSKTTKSSTPAKLTSALLSRLFKDFALSGSDKSRAIIEFFISLDTPVSLSCLILYKAGEFLQLSLKEINPSHYNDPEKFRDDFAAICFLRKNRFLETGLDLQKIALDAFRKSEDTCKATNHRFRYPNFDPLYSGPNVYMLDACKRKIARILGRFDIDELLDMGSWGPGVTTFCKGRDVSASRKFREERGITSRAYQLLSGILPSAYPRWFDEDKMKSLVPVEVNHVITVPKNAKTDRTIGIEPGLNSFFQLGVGRMIRRRLRIMGYDLNSDFNNRLSAFKGSVDGYLATVDFSAASDTIAREVVNYLLPDDWLIVMNSLRSPCHNLDGTITPYQKYSAMGNGFTFELESMIFLVAALVVCEQLSIETFDVSVFGDDIILPVKGFELYTSFCNYLGFRVNPEKSFSSTYFRESCGSYYFKGVDVKPLFLKEDIQNAKSIYKLVNGIRALAHRRNSFCGCDRKLGPVWQYLVRRLPSALRAYGTVSSGDACIHVNFDEATPSIARDGWCGFYHSGFIEQSVQREDDGLGLLNSRLWRASVDRSYGNAIDLRSVTRIRFKKHMFISQWYNFGSWN